MLVSRDRPLVNAGRAHWFDLTFQDLTAEDWIPYVMDQEQPDDDSTIRFSLLEIE